MTEFNVYGWAERGISTTVEADSVEEAEEIAIEQLKDDLRELGVPLDAFHISIDEVVR